MATFSPPIESADARVLVRRQGRPMATDVSVQIAASPDQEAAAQAAADACMSWFDEVDRRLSRFRPESELSQLNARAGSWFAASELLYTVTELAASAAQASAGLFDPTMLRDLEALGYDRDFALIAQREAGSPRPLDASAGQVSPAQRAAWRAIGLDPVRRRLKLPSGAQLDLGGIAKGWAADIALDRYCAPFPGALVNVGGDLRVCGGPEPGVAWSVGIRRPADELVAAPAPEDSPTSYAAVLTFSRGGLATSGAVRRWWLRDGQRQHHLIDPRTGRPAHVWIDERDSPAPGERDGAQLVATATALAPTAAQAEVAAKVALLRGHPNALRTVEAAWARYGAVGPATDADAGVALILTFGNGEVALSGNLRSYLDSWGTQGAALSMNVAMPYTSSSAPWQW
jgi:thiamine biosynthesis lipoprotein